MQRLHEPAREWRGEGVVAMAKRKPRPPGYYGGKQGYGKAEWIIGLMPPPVLEADVRRAIRRNGGRNDAPR